MVKCFSIDVQVNEDAYGRHAEVGDAQSDVVHEAIRNDELRRLEHTGRSAAESTVLQAAKIIATRIHTSYDDAYDWCIDQVCYGHHAL